MTSLGQLTSLNTRTEKKYAIWCDMMSRIPGKAKDCSWGYMGIDGVLGLCNYVELIDPTFRDAGGVD